MERGGWEPRVSFEKGWFFSIGVDFLCKTKWVHQIINGQAARGEVSPEEFSPFIKAKYWAKHSSSLPLGVALSAPKPCGVVGCSSANPSWVGRSILSSKPWVPSAATFARSSCSSKRCSSCWSSWAVGWKLSVKGGWHQKKLYTKLFSYPHHLSNNENSLLRQNEM